MADRESLNIDQFMNTVVPPGPGEAPIPEGTMRIQHYTWPGESEQKTVKSIREHGLLRSKGEESYAQGGTESPEVFATSGVRGIEADMTGSSKIWVEGYVHPEQLNVGAFWRGPPSEEDLREREAGDHTVTLMGDLPPKQIVGVHQPWHKQARYLAENPDTAHEWVHGDAAEMETGDKPTDQAIHRLRSFYRGFT